MYRPSCGFYFMNRPRSIYQYSNMAPRLSGQTSIFGVVFFVFESLLGIERQRKLKRFTILARKPRSHVRILIYRTWPIARKESFLSCSINSVCSTVIASSPISSSRFIADLFTATLSILSFLSFPPSSPLLLSSSVVLIALPSSWFSLASVFEFKKKRQHFSV